MLPVSSESAASLEVGVFKWTTSYTPFADGALALLFKVMTVFNLSPHSPLSEDLQSGWSSLVRSTTHSHVLVCRGEGKPACIPASSVAQPHQGLSLARSALLI